MKLQNLQLQINYEISTSMTRAKFKAASHLPPPKFMYLYINYYCIYLLKNYIVCPLRPNLAQKYFASWTVVSPSWRSAQSHTFFFFLSFFFFLRSGSSSLFFFFFLGSESEGVSAQENTGYSMRLSACENVSGQYVTWW